MSARWPLLGAMIAVTGCDVAIEFRSRATTDAGAESSADGAADVASLDVMEADAREDSGISQPDATIDGGAACANDMDCGALARCVAGVCEPRCAPTVETCNGSDDDCDGMIDEADPMSATLCPAGQACSGGACRPTGGCPAGTVACAGVCANLATDARNCGACGSGCAAGQRCAMGACTP
jgi:hypothetical protein